MHEWSQLPIDRNDLNAELGVDEARNAFVTCESIYETHL